MNILRLCLAVVAFLTPNMGFANPFDLITPLVAIGKAVKDKIIEKQAENDPIANLTSSQKCRLLNQNFQYVLAKEKTEKLPQKIRAYAKEAINIDCAKVFHTLASKRPEVFSQRDGNHQTYAHLAAYYARPRVLQALAAVAPETLVFQDLQGRTPAHLAAHVPEYTEANFFDMVAIKKSASKRWIKTMQIIAKTSPQALGIIDPWGNTPAHYAAESEQDGVFAAIVEHLPATLTIQNKEGLTPTHMAQSAETFKIISELAPHTFSLKDANGHTPLQRNAKLNYIGPLREMIKGIPQELLSTLLQESTHEGLKAADILENLKDYRKDNKELIKRMRQLEVRDEIFTVGLPACLDHPA